MKFIAAPIATLMFVLTLTATVPARSAPADNSCANATTTIELNNCAQKEFEKKDRELNVAYQALMKSLTPSKPIGTINYAEVRSQLIKAQQSWIQFRDNDCNAKYRLRQDGSIRNLIALECKMEHTDVRIKQLKDWVGQP
jgi:uncharacterized protein YecT (DUF1311 family)